MSIKTLLNRHILPVLRGQKSVSVVFSWLTPGLTLTTLIYVLIALTIMLIIYNCYYPEFSFVFAVLGWSQFIQSCLLVLVIIKYKK